MIVNATTAQISNECKCYFATKITNVVAASDYASCVMCVRFYLFNYVFILLNFYRNMITRPQVVVLLL